MAAPDYAEMFRLVRNAHPGSADRAAEAPRQALGTSLDDFEGIAPAAARQVMAHWWRHPRYLDAIETIEDGREE